MQHVKEFRERNRETAQRIAESITSLAALGALDAQALYPELSLESTDGVSFFNPYCVGDSNNAFRFGTGGNLLELMPFYEHVIVEVARVPEAMFTDCYGVAWPTFLSLVESGRVLPLLPTSVSPHPFYGSRENLEYLRPLYDKTFPSSDRFFEVSQLAMLRVAGGESGFDVFALQKEVAAFGATLFGVEHVINWLRLCNRAIYRGDPFQLAIWEGMARNNHAAFSAAGMTSDQANYLTLYLLDLLDDAFNIAKAGGATHNYARHLHKDVERQTANKNRVSYVLPDDHLAVLRHISSEMDRVISVDEVALLRRHFVYEPLEAVGDEKKFIKWLERSENVRENRAVLEAFVRHLRTGDFTSIIKTESDVGERLTELNREIKTIDTYARVAEVTLEIAAVIGSALGGKVLGTALSTHELGSVFSACGALAAAVLTKNHAAPIVTKALNRAYGRNAAILLWTRSRNVH